MVERIAAADLDELELVALADHADDDFGDFVGARDERGPSRSKSSGMRRAVVGREQRFAGRGQGL
jgi:hypothetical protein